MLYSKPGCFQDLFVRKVSWQVMGQNKMTGCITWTVEPSDWKIIQFSHFRFDYLYLAIVLFISFRMFTNQLMQEIQYPQLSLRNRQKQLRISWKGIFFLQISWFYWKGKIETDAQISIFCTRCCFSWFLAGNSKDSQINFLPQELPRETLYANCPKFSRQYKHFLIKSNYLYS